MFRGMELFDDEHWGLPMTNLRLFTKTTAEEHMLGCLPQKQVLGVGQNVLGCGGVLDTGTSLLSFPEGAVKNLREAFRNLQDCSDIHQLPEICFDLAGNQHCLPPQGYVGIV